MVFCDKKRGGTIQWYHLEYCTARSVPRHDFRFIVEVPGILHLINKQPTIPLNLTIIAIRQRQSQIPKLQKIFYQM